MAALSFPRVLLYDGGLTESRPSVSFAVLVLLSGVAGNQGIMAERAIYTILGIAEDYKGARELRELE